MSIRRLETISNNQTGCSAKVFRNSELGEWVVRFYQGDKHLTDADYFTDDKADAQGTARIVWRTKD